MESKIAKIISVVFHPLLMPTYAMVILLHLRTYFSMIIPGNAKWNIIGLLFIITFILPVIMNYFLLRLKVIKSFEMREREERIFPFIITIVFFYLAYYMTKGLGIDPLFSYFSIGATFVAVMALLINFFWKISIHMLAIGALFGLVLGTSLNFVVNNTLLLFCIILVAGLVGFARLKLKAHTHAQVYVGFLLGATLLLLMLLSL
jgi:membrane-associated phospholipid phosphatase